MKFNKKLLIAVFILLLGLGISLIMSNRQSTSPSEDLASKLYKLKGTLVGDNSKVTQIIDLLTYGEYRKEIELQTKDVPYGLKVTYDFKGTSIQDSNLQSNYRQNAALIFTLIENVEKVEFKLTNINGFTSPYEYYFERNDFPDNKKITSSEKQLRNFSETNNINIIVTPTKFTPLISSSPGMKIQLNNTHQYPGINKIKYETNGGSFLTWNEKTGEISVAGQEFIGNINTTVYWSPIAKDGKQWEKDENPIRITYIDQDRKVLTTQTLTIYYKDQYYLSETSNKNSSIKYEIYKALSSDSADLEMVFSVDAKDSEEKIISRAIENATKTAGALDVNKNDYVISIYDQTGMKKMYTYG